MSDTPPNPGTEPAGEQPRPTPSSAAPRRGYLRASALMASGSMVSRVLGFVRNFLMGMIVAGTGSAVSDAVSAANYLPNSIWILVGGGVLNAILVPAIVRAIERPDRGEDYISRLMTLVVLAATTVTALCTLAVPALILLTSGTMPEGTSALAIQLGYWMMPQIIFSALYVMCGQILNAHESFGPYQWAPVLNNVVGIVGALAFLGIWGSEGDPSNWTWPMVIALAAFNVGGSAAQVAFLLYYVRKLGLRLRPRWGLRGLGLGKLSRMGLWTFAMLGIAQVGIWASRWSTTNAREASATLTDQGRTLEAARHPALFTLDSAYMAFMIPQGIIAVALVTASFPAIARSASRGDHDEVLREYARTSRILAVPMVLCTAVFAALSAPIMWVIIGGTGRVAAEANALVLVGYMVGLVPFAATYLVKRVFYAYEDARTPFLMQIPATLAPVLCVLPILHLVPAQYAAAAAAGSSSLGSLAGWLLGLWLLSRRVHGLGADTSTAGRTAVVLSKLLLAGVLTTAVGLGLYWLLGDLFWIHRVVAVGLGAGVGLVMTLVFVGLAWMLRVEELRAVVARVRRRRG
ncbi:MAG: lipid II flippase MurJ [Brachybacterium sp.]|nr:lipid II flippase MurJ [Brachybacterium sp.]